MNIIKSRIFNQPIGLIVFFGFLVRLFFWVFVAKVFLGNSMYISGDTTGWTDSFLNLLKHGHYTFDLANKDAYFGRVPGYSFFWGINYLIVGSEYVYQSVAFSQIILDCISIFLVYKISLSIFKNNIAAYVSGVIYALYPFVILWVTVSYSEVFSNFLNILCIYLVLRPNKKNVDCIILGLVIAVLFLTREFVAISLVFVCLYIILDSTIIGIQKRFSQVVFVLLGFLLLYSTWPIRNYYNHDRLILTRSNKGFVFYQEDYSAFRSWVVCWDNDEVTWLQKAVTNNYNIVFPEGVFYSNEDRELASNTLLLCARCGSSFEHWERVFDVKNNLRQEGSNCNEEIAANFSKLQYNYIKHKPIEYLTKVPFLNFKKALFKSTAKNHQASLMHSMLFLYRSILVLLGLAGILYNLRNKKMMLVYGYVFFIYIFFSFIIRYIEMRNLLQADTLLLIPAGWTIAVVLEKIVSVIRKREEQC